MTFGPRTSQLRNAVSGFDTHSQNSVECTPGDAEQQQASAASTTTHQRDDEDQDQRELVDEHQRTLSLGNAMGDNPDDPPRGVQCAQHLHRQSWTRASFRKRQGSCAQRHQSELTLPGAMSVGGAADDQSVDVQSSFSSIDRGIGMGLPLQAYMVSPDVDGDGQRADESLDDILALRNELQQIGDAVDDINGALNNIVEADTVEDTTLPQQQNDGQQGGKYRRATFVAFLSCVGLFVSLLVVGLDSKSQTLINPQDGGTKSCFADRDELLQAVDDFMMGENAGPNPNLAKRYGWPMNAWCVGKVQNFSRVFSHDRNPSAPNFNEDISSWDMSNATDMEAMFLGATSFNQDLSSWSVSSVETMQGMFDGAISFDGDVSTWDVSNVRHMGHLFVNSAFSGDISTWNVSKVENFQGTFLGSVFNGNISGWDVSGSNTMASMFQNTTSFNQDLSSWDVSRVTNTSRMFLRASEFNGDVSTWDVSNVIDARNMFSGAAKFEGGDLSAWDVSQCTNMSSMFSSAEAFNGSISTWDVSRVKDMKWMFYDAEKFNQDLSSWDVSMVDTFHGQFRGARSFRQNLCEWGNHVDNGAEVTRMFFETSCPNQNDPDLSSSVAGPFCLRCPVS